MKHIEQAFNDAPPTAAEELRFFYLKHLCAHAGATATTPIHTYYDHNGLSRCVTDRHLARYLRLVASALQLLPGVNPTVGALRCTGATALMQQGRHGLHLIKFIGRWRSDEVFH